jgi:hypothetical protein
MPPVQGLTLNRLHQLIISGSPLSSSHNALSGIQGGTSGEYYHLTSAQYSALGVSSSYATTASYASVAQIILGTVTSASYAVTSSWSSKANTATSATSATSASYALTSSYAPSTGIDGSGTANYVAKFTGAGTTIGNSTLVDDGVSVYTPTYIRTGRRGLDISGYTSFGATVSGEMTILGHNTFVDSSSANMVRVKNSSWYPAMVKMYYNEGITFHTTGSTGTANAVFFEQGGTTNEVVRIDNNGYMWLWNGRLYLVDTNTYLTEGTGNSVRVQTNSGYIDVGPQNSDFAHLQTDRDRFYFNKRIVVDEGIVESYNQDLTLRRETSGSSAIVIGNVFTTYTNTEQIFKSGSTTLFTMDGDSNYNRTHQDLIPPSDGGANLGWISPSFRYATIAGNYLACASGRQLSGSSEGWHVDYGTTYKPKVAAAIVTQSAAPAGASSYPYGTIWGQYT